MELEVEKLGCEKCGSKDIGAFVQHGSYFTQCISCGATGPVTSWMAIAPHMTHKFRAFVVNDQFKLLEDLGSGAGSALIDAVSQKARQGKLVRLVRERTSIA